MFVALFEKISHISAVVSLKLNDFQEEEKVCLYCQICKIEDRKLKGLLLRIKETK